MTLVLTIDILVLIGLCGIVLLRGLEAALPFATFVLVLVPDQSRFRLPGAFEITTQRVVVIALLLLYLLLHRKTGNTMRIGEIPLRWIMAAQLAWALLSTANSVVPLISFKKMLSQAVEYYLLYFIYTRTITKSTTVHKILQAMVSAIIGCCVLGTVQAYTGWAVTHLFPAEAARIGGGMPERTARGLRVWSTFPHPILFGVAIAIVVPITLYLLTRARTPMRKAWIWSGLMLMFLNIYKTGSRGPWLALVLAALSVFFFGPRRLRVYLLVIAMLCVTVLISRPGVWQTLDTMYNQTMNPNTQLGKSYDYRYALRRVSQDAVDADVSRALFGYGMGSFFYLNLESFFDGRLYRFQSCDSTWLEFMVETGYVGLLLMVLLLFKAAKVPWSDYRQLPAPQKYVSLVLFVGIAAYCFAMLSVNLYSWGQEGYMLWAMIALAVVYGKLARVEHSHSPNARLSGLQMTALTGCDKDILDQLAPAGKASFRVVEGPRSLFYKS